MKINRMSEDKSAPSWFFEKLDDKSSFSDEYISPDSAQKISSSSVSDNDLVSQRDEIEKCTKEGKSYHYNAKWSDKVKSELKEYALACGMNMDRFKAVRPENIDNIISVHKEANMSPEETKKDSKMALKDPFKIDEINEKKSERSDWQEIKKAKNLSDKPSMDSRVIPVRGGEDINKNSDPKVARGQNSIKDPDAIKREIESSPEDTGARLRRENKEKEASKKTNHQEWQKEKIKAMAGKEIIPNRKVFPTEVMNAQTGIKKEPFDYSDMPEKTDGEKLKESQVEHKKSIRGEDKKKHEFNIQSETKASVSDTFAEELKKHLKK